VPLEGDLLRSDQLSLRFAQDQAILTVGVPGLDDITILVECTIVVESLHLVCGLDLIVSGMLPSLNVVSGDAHGLFCFE
jgi:hypothetical protein